MDETATLDDDDDDACRSDHDYNLIAHRTPLDDATMKITNLLSYFLLPLFVGLLLYEQLIAVLQMI